MLASISDVVPDMPLGSWADWFAAVCTGLAFLVAAIAYTRDVRARRWAQARLVHVELRGVARVRTNDLATISPGDARIGSEVEYQPVLQFFTAGPMSAPQPDSQVECAQPTVAVTAAVHNGGDELLGPVSVRAYEGRNPEVQWGRTLEFNSVNPASQESLVFLMDGSPYRGVSVRVELEVTFRDSAGRWWRRRGVEPVRRARDKEREIRRAGRAVKRQRLRVRWGSAFPASVRQVGLHLRARWDAGKNSG